MSKKKRREWQDRSGQGQGPGQGQGQEPDDAPPPAAPPVDPKYLSWGWYAKIFAGCVVFSTILFVIFVSIMKGISRRYTEDGIAMYEMAKRLQDVKNPHPDTIAGELSALDAVVDIEKLKSFLLSDVAYKPAVTEDTRAWIRAQDEKYGELQEHLKEVTAFNDVQRKIRDKTYDKIGQIRECLREILVHADMPNREDYRKKVIRLDKKIGQLSWYSQIAAGFFSWPAALDAAERSFFEALRFWQKNQEASYWWGKVLDETSITDVAAEKKIMAIRFDPKSKLADKILDEIKAEYELDTTSARRTYNYAFALYRKGRTAEAIPLYKTVADRDPEMNSFEGFLARRRLDIIERHIDMRWYKTDDF